MIVYRKTDGCIPVYVVGRGDEVQKASYVVKQKRRFFGYKETQVRVIYLHDEDEMGELVKVVGSDEYSNTLGFLTGNIKYQTVRTGNKLDVEVTFEVGMYPYIYLIRHAFFGGWIVNGHSPHREDDLEAINKDLSPVFKYISEKYIREIPKYDDPVIINCSSKEK